MKKQIGYFVTCNGLYASFDYAIHEDSKLRFYRSSVGIFNLDLNVSKFVFTQKGSVGVYDTYYFEIVPFKDVY